VQCISLWCSADGVKQCGVVYVSTPMDQPLFIWVSGSSSKHSQSCSTSENWWQVTSPAHQYPH